MYQTSSSSEHIPFDTLASLGSDLFGGGTSVNIVDAIVGRILPISWRPTSGMTAVGHVTKHNVIERLKVQQEEWWTYSGLVSIWTLSPLERAGEGDTTALPLRLCIGDLISSDEQRLERKVGSQTETGPWWHWAMPWLWKSVLQE